jgi:hypothetical protein
MSHQTEQVTASPIPVGILLESMYRDAGNWKTGYRHVITNTEQLEEATIASAFAFIGDDQVTMARYDLPNGAPICHPDEPCGEDDHCYMEIIDITYLYNDAAYQAALRDAELHDTDIAVTVTATQSKEKATPSWLEICAAIHQQRIDDAVSVLDEAGHAVIKNAKLDDIQSRLLPRDIDRETLVRVASVALTNNKLLTFLNDECEIPFKEAYALQAALAKYC